MTASPPVEPHPVADRCSRGLATMRSLTTVPSTARAFTRVVAHLDLDGARVATGPAFGEHEQGELLEQGVEMTREGAGREVPRTLPEAADEKDGIPVAQAQGRHLGALRGAGHDKADEGVGEREAP